MVIIFASQFRCSKASYLKVLVSGELHIAVPSNGIHCYKLQSRICNLRRKVGLLSHASLCDTLGSDFADWVSTFEPDIDDCRSNPDTRPAFDQVQRRSFLQATLSQSLISVQLHLSLLSSAFGTTDSTHSLQLFFWWLHGNLGPQCHRLSQSRSAARSRQLNTTPSHPLAAVLRRLLARPTQVLPNLQSRRLF